MKSKNTTPRADAETAVFGSAEMLQPAPTDTIPQHSTTEEIAYQIVKDETYPQTQPRLNLATFVTTYMDEYATRLMNEAINMNFIDETEYPRVAVMSSRCINILANLWNTPEEGDSKTGALAIGSSEACMLGGVAAWLRWRKRRQQAGKPLDKPNFVISAGYQVVWEKFAQLWQIEMRTVPLTREKITLDPQDALAMCDENTICIVPIEGVTWTGLNDDVAALDRALDEYNARTGNEVCIHVDAASGGFILPFLDPDTQWDFRLKWVLSISTSGHKFGLVYPGLGWVVWKDKQYLPDEMNFSVNYLGAEVSQVGLNFSRPAAQVLGQYYQFIRLGFEGYRDIQQSSMDVAKYLHDEIGKFGQFKNYSDDVVNPLFIWSMNPDYDQTAKWTLYDLQSTLQQSGWMVPAYTLPDNLTNEVVMRIVCRQGFSRDMADMLLGDIRNAIQEFEKLQYPTQTRLSYEKKEHIQGKVFTHTGGRVRSGKSDHSTDHSDEQNVASQSESVASDDKSHHGWFGLNSSRRRASSGRDENPDRIHQDEDLKEDYYRNVPNSPDDPANDPDARRGKSGIYDTTDTADDGYLVYDEEDDIFIDSDDPSLVPDSEEVIEAEAAVDEAGDSDENFSRADRMDYDGGNYEDPEGSPRRRGAADRSSADSRTSTRRTSVRKPVKQTVK